MWSCPSSTEAWCRTVKVTTEEKSNRRKGCVIYGACSFLRHGETWEIKTCFVPSLVPTHMQSIMPSFLLQRKHTKSGCLEMDSRGRVAQRRRPWRRRRRRCCW